MKNAKEKKGITLVALIITIIVMLILVGVTVRIVIQSNLFEIARNAVNETEKKYDEEKDINQIIIHNETYNNLQEYIDQEL